MKRIPEEQRSSFTLSSEGSYIHWPEADVHIDLDAVRYLKDDEWREKKDQERLMYDIRFGEAVAAFRKQCGLKQAEIQGLSERHVRRIEKGERTKVDTLGVLARSHGLSLHIWIKSPKSFQEVVRLSPRSHHPRRYDPAFSFNRLICKDRASSRFFAFIRCRISCSYADMRGV